MKTFKEMIEEIENGNIYYHCLYSSKYENLKDAIEYMIKIKQNKVCALSKDGGLLTGYVHYFNENGYLYSYVNDIKVNIYEN